MIIGKEITYQLPDQTPLFSKLSFSLEAQKTGLIGRNGTGKSTLLALICQEKQPTEGLIEVHRRVGYLAQNRFPHPEQTVAEALSIQEKITALERILKGISEPNDYEILEEDWTLEERYQEAFKQLGLRFNGFFQKVGGLSGGELTKLALVRLLAEPFEYLLLDEPSNHLDQESRDMLCRFIENCSKGMLVASHDRDILERMDQIFELSSLGLKRYGGPYSEYLRLKELEEQAKFHQYQHTKNVLKEVHREIQRKKEIKIKRDHYGKKQRKSGSQPKILLNGMKNQSERTQGKMSQMIHRLEQEAIHKKQTAQQQLEFIQKMEWRLPSSGLHTSKKVLEMEQLSFRYANNATNLFSSFSFQIQGPERIALLGPNGSGKSTLLCLIMGHLKPIAGTVSLNVLTDVLAQGGRIFESNSTVLDVFQNAYPNSNESHCRSQLALFLFRGAEVFKMVRALSGGERIRLTLACLFGGESIPQLLILDEPTNHLDLESILVLENALIHYDGALLVVSHDRAFLKKIRVQRELRLDFS